MKKSIFTAAAIAVLTIVSCSKENGAENISTTNFTFKASVETPTPEAKAGLAADGKSLEWKIGDEVTLFFPKEGTPGSSLKTVATVSSIDKNGVATFSSEIPEDADTSEIIASYNDKSGATETDLHPFIVKDNDPYTRHRVVIPAIQTATAGNYDPASMPLVGHWKGNAGDPVTILFKNMAALLAIDITNNSSETIKSVIFYNKKNYVSGYFYYLSANREGFSWKQSKDNCKEVSLNGNITDGKYYFIISGQPQTLTGLTVSFITTSGKAAVFSNPEDLSVERNTIYNIGAITLTDKDFVEGLAFSDTKVNMDDDFYTELIKSCGDGSSAGKYSLSNPVTIDGITLTPKTTSDNIVLKTEKFDSYFTKNSNKVSFKSASTGNAELVLYCALVAKKAITMTWDGKTVPDEITAALTNSTEKDQYYDEKNGPLHLMLPAVEKGDKITLTMGNASGFRIYKFYWKSAPSVE